LAADYDPNQQVDLMAVAEILNEHLDGALVRSAYEKLRTTERERTWTLNHMMAFWVAVTLRAPPSLGQALREAAGSPTSIYPHVTASPQAFFQRSSSMRWEFFAEVFRAFTQSIREAEPARFASHQRDTAKHFENILVLDGSNLDPVARRLKILWKDMSTPIPGAMFACYDLRRGALADLWYSPTLRRGELTLAREALGQLPAGALLLGDRLYGTPKFLSEVQESGRWGVFRKQSQVKCRSEKLLGRYESDGAVLEDWEVELGKAAGLPARLIRLRRGEKTYEYVTNVLDPEVLSAEAIAELYRDRWQVERMFQDLKTVLNLKCFYCGNTNAVAMQIYAAAIVYCALRIGQGRIAYEASIEPEAISTPKLFPLLAATAATLTTLEYGFFRTELENPEVKLRKPDWRTACRLRTKLKDILADKTRGKRPRDKRSNAPRRPQWREIPPPPGAP
jgi:hypothetical protein